MPVHWASGSAAVRTPPEPILFLEGGNEQERKITQNILTKSREVRCIKKLFVSTSFLYNLARRFFKKRPSFSLLHCSGYMWAPEAASGAAEIHGWAGETCWNRPGLQPPSHSLLLVTHQRKCHTVAPALLCIPLSMWLHKPLHRLDCSNSQVVVVLEVVLWNQTRKTTCQIL